MNISIFWPGIV